MASKGNFLPPFSTAYDDKEDWDCYVERFELFLTANGIDLSADDSTSQVVAIFLHSLGAHYYGVIRDLVAPAKPKSKSYSDLHSLMRKHLKAPPIVVAERRKLIKRDQGPSEAIADYVVALKHLSLHCNYGEKLDENLRDRFVSGLRSENTSLKLMERARDKPDLSFNEAVDFALARETTVNEAKGIRGDMSGATKTGINAVRDKSGEYRSRHPSTNSGKKCYRCGRGSHCPDQCWFKDTECFKCHKKGHISKRCNSKATSKQRQSSRYQESEDQDQEKRRDKHWNNSKKKRHDDRQKYKHSKTKSVHKVNQDQYTSDSDEDYTVLRVSNRSNSNRSSAIMVPMCIEKQIIDMELDTGSGVSMIPYTMYQRRFKHLDMNKSSRVFTSVTGEIIKPVGKVRVHVTYEDQRAELCLYIVDTKHSLLGRDWLQVIRLNWRAIDFTGTESDGVTVVEKVKSMEHLNQILEKHSTLFSHELGKMKHIKAKIAVQENAQPVTSKPYKVPYALRPQVERELTRLQNCGVLTPVTHSQWSTSILAVPKSDGSVRICGNYKTTVNPVLKPIAPPNINVEDIFANLSGGVKFSKLDLAHAYNQMELDEESKQYLTISTHKGLFQQNRLVFGITTAPAIWQNTIEQVLQGLAGVQVYLDDILVTGHSEQEHLENLERVLTRLEGYGLKLKNSKCEFMRTSVEYLGHVIDKEGVHKATSKVDQILDMPIPRDVTSLRSFLGMLNYYRRFIPNLAAAITPLTALLEKSHKSFQWSSEADKAFRKAKQLLQDSGFLVHFDPELPVTIATDASPTGIGAVLSHIMPNGEERPVQFASRSLTKAERGYPQIEREALAIVYAMKKFHMFIYGRRFILITDNKPLTAIFGPKTGLPVLAAERMQRWAMFMAGFNYEIQYRNSKENANADCLSRLPCQSVSDSGEPMVSHLFHVDILPCSHEQIRNKTKKDLILSKVIRYSLDGWPSKLPETEDELKAYFHRRNEITYEQGVLMWGARIIVPEKCRRSVLEEVHSGHIGIVKMKAVARSYVWWPKMDAEIEKCAKSCVPCQKIQNQPALAPLHPWIPASKPWERIHVDFAGPFEGHTYLVVVDAFSKWPEVFIMPTVTSERTIDILRSLFSRNGLPQILVSDNGGQFTSAEFQKFTSDNGINHKFSAPYHPSTNGQAERFVQSLKQGLRAARQDNCSAQTKLSRFLLAYRNAAHAVTGESPAMLFMRRTLRTRLDSLRPDVNRRVKEQLHQQIQHRYKRALDRHLSVGEQVWIRNYIGKEKWVAGVVVEKQGPVNYTVSVLETGSVWTRHIEQLRTNFTSPDEYEISPESPKLTEVRAQGQPCSTPHPNFNGTETHEPVRKPEKKLSGDMHIENTQLTRLTGEMNPQMMGTSSPDGTTQISSPVKLRRSNRVRKAPDKLDL